MSPENLVSLGYVVIFPAITILFVFNTYIGSVSGFLFFLLCALISFSFYVVLLAISFVSGRSRRALSILCGLAAGSTIVWNAGTFMGWAESAKFSHERPEFDEMVRLQRARKPEAEAIRMVVKFEDRSMFATANSFLYVIYDETDEAIRRPDSVRGHWRYPKSETGIINVGGKKTVEQLSGHYYRFWTND